MEKALSHLLLNQKKFHGLQQKENDTEDQPLSREDPGPPTLKLSFRCRFLFIVNGTKTYFPAQNRRIRRNNLTIDRSKSLFPSTFPAISTRALIPKHQPIKPSTSISCRTFPYLPLHKVRLPPPFIFIAVIYSTPFSSTHINIQHKRDNKMKGPSLLRNHRIESFFVLYLC